MKPFLLLGFIAFLLPGILPAQQLMWPGDANDNGVVSHIDVLYIGLGFGSTGPIRSSASPNWLPQQINSLWSQSFPGGLNYAFADCDGNGIINGLDLVTIDTNYNRVTTPAGGTDSSSISTNASPALTLNFLVDSITVANQTTIITNLELGDSTNYVDSLYGIAFTMTYDPMIVDGISFNLGGGWIASSGGGSPVIGQAWVKDSLGQIDVVITRTNQTNGAGAGLIGSINIVMDDNIRVASNYDLPLGIASLYAITRSESKVLLRGVGDTLAIDVPLATQTEPQHPWIDLYPNPAQQFVVIEAENLNTFDLHLYDGMGNMVRRFSPTHARRDQLDLSQLPTGIYFLELRNQEARIRKKFLLIP